MDWKQVEKIAYTKKAGNRNWLSCFTPRFWQMVLLVVALIGFAIGGYIALYTMQLRGLM